MERPKPTVYWDLTDPNINPESLSEHSITRDFDTIERRIRPKRVVDWDKIDPATGLSIGCKVACEIIDGLNHRELHLFNAPRRDNPTITAGELIERYMALKSQKGETNDVKDDMDDEDSDGPEDEEGEMSAVVVDVRRKEVDGSTMAKEDEVQEPINEITRTQEKTPTEDSNADDVEVRLRKDGLKRNLQGIEGREGH